MYYTYVHIHTSYRKSIGNLFVHYSTKNIPQEPDRYKIRHRHSRFKRFIPGSFPARQIEEKQYLIVFVTQEYPGVNVLYTPGDGLRGYPPVNRNQMTFPSRLLIGH